MHDALYKELVRLAKTGDATTNYSTIAPLVKLDISRADDRDEIGHLLGEISRFEHEAGRPLLSALVMYKDGDKPGRGFFELAKELGLYDGKNDDAFFSEELTKVFKYWHP